MPEIDKDEIARRGDALYAERVRPNVDEDAQYGQFVAIDVETGAWEVGAERLAVTNRLIERTPAAEGRIWLTRVGMRHAVRFGGRQLESES